MCRVWTVSIRQRCYRDDAPRLLYLAAATVAVSNNGDDDDDGQGVSMACF